MEGESPTLKEQCALDKFGFTYNRNISRLHILKDGIHLSDLGTNILASNFIDFLNRFILSKSIEYSGLYTDKHLKGLNDNIDAQIPDNSLSPELVNDINNLGSASSNWNSHNVKDYVKSSSDPKLVLEYLKFKSNSRLVIGNLNINTLSNIFDELKLIIPRKVDSLGITEIKADSNFPLNQFSVKGY